jgi:hypothetical protein
MRLHYDSSDTTGQQPLCIAQLHMLFRQHCQTCPHGVTQRSVIGLHAAVCCQLPFRDLQLELVDEVIMARNLWGGRLSMGMGQERLSARRL